MRIELPPLASLADLTYDTVIDVRAPAEFAEDRMPGAVNLPVLSDAERARVGTVYVQEAPFKARKIGGALVARNIAAHLEGPLADKSGAWRPLVYCWRGGQRSGAFALWLREVGWRVDTLAGGYQSYRRAVVAQLYDHPVPHRIVLLDGDTGTAKTDLLHRVSARGGQVVDLEGLANHRGSVLGIRPGGQPSQKMFESRLSAALSALDPARPVLVEAESSKVGNLLVPPALWKAMRSAPRIQIDAEAGERARYLCRRYADLFADLPAFQRQLGLLSRIQGHARISRWQEMATQGAFELLVRDLIDHHYDARYRRARHGAPAPVLRLSTTLDAEGLDRTADRLMAEVADAAEMAARTPLDDRDVRRPLGEVPDLSGDGASVP